MNIVKLTKIIGLSTVTSQVCLFADTYKLEVTGDEGKVRFCVTNFTKGWSNRESNSFSVTNDECYNSDDCSVDKVITRFELGAFLEFSFGTFRVCYDYRDGFVRLDKGSFEDTLLIEKSDFPIVIKNGTELKIHTFIVEKIATFKNEGTLNAFVTVMQDCQTVENRGCFRSRNLFLSNARIQNYDTVIFNDARKEVNGGIDRKIPNSSHPEKGGCIKKEMATGNTEALTNLTPDCNGRMILDNGCWFAFPQLQRQKYYSYHSVEKNRDYTVVFVGSASTNVNSYFGCTTWNGPFKQLGAIERFGITNSTIWITRCSPIKNIISPCFTNGVYSVAINPKPALYFIYDNPNDHKR